MNIAIKKLTSITSDSAAKLKDTIWRPLWKILIFSPANDTISAKKNLSASIEKGTLSVAYGSRFLSRIKIKGVREYSFEEGKYPQPEGLASSLALAINDFRAAGTDLSLNIPKAWAVIKTADFPVTVKENLPDAVSYELDRLTPFSPEDAFYDFKILREGAEKLTILVMAARADLVKPYIEALREKDITVNRITVNLSGIGTLCRYIDKETDFIFIEISSKGYEGALFLDGFINNAFAGGYPPIPPLVRGGEGGVKWDTEGLRGGEGGVEKSKVDTLMSEIDPFIAAAKKQGKLPEIIVLLKDKSPTLRELLKLQINPPVRILNETDIKFMSGSTRTEPSGPQAKIPFAAIGGVLESLWSKANGLDLLKKGRHEIPRTPMVFTVILMLSIIAMWILYMIAPLKIEGKRLNEIDRQIMLRKEEVRKVETLKKEIDTLNDEISTINNFKENRPKAMNILKELTAILPKTTWLTRVRVTESTVDIEGYAGSASLLLPKLEASTSFKKAEFSSPTFRDARMNADRFNIKMEIEGVKKDEGERLKNEKE